MSHHDASAASFVSEDSLDVGPGPALHRANTLTPSSFLRHQAAHQQEQTQERDPSTNSTNSSTCKDRRVARAGVLALDCAMLSSESSATEAATVAAAATLSAMSTSSTMAASIPSDDSPQILYSPVYSIGSAISSAANTPHCRAPGSYTTVATSPGASTYYSSRVLPSSASTTSVVSVELPHRGASTNSDSTSATSSTHILPLDVNTVSGSSNGNSMGTIVLSMPRAMRLGAGAASYSSPPMPPSAQATAASLSGTPLPSPNAAQAASRATPRLQPPLKTAAPARAILEGTYSYFVMNGERVQSLPRACPLAPTAGGSHSHAHLYSRTPNDCSLRSSSNSTSSSMLAAPFKAAPLPSALASFPITSHAQAAPTSQQQQQQQPSQPNHSVLLREQDAAGDDLFMSKEFLAFMGDCSGAGVFAELSGTTSASASANNSTTQGISALNELATLSSTTSSTTTGNHPHHCADRDSVTVLAAASAPTQHHVKSLFGGCSLNDAGVHDATTNSVVNVEAMKSFSRNGARRSMRFGSQM